MKRRLALMGLAIGLIASPVHAAPIVLINANFEAGDFSGWSSFVTAAGTTGSPAVVTFDVDGDGASSAAARFQVGQQAFAFGVYEGGGIFQNFVSDAGLLSVALAIAARNDGSNVNASGGRFTVLVDGSAVAGHDFGEIGPLATERFALGGTTSIGAGVHELRILMERPFTIGAGVGATPFQYVDDVSAALQPSAVPEPVSLFLFGTGALGVLAARRRRHERR